MENENEKIHMRGLEDQLGKDDTSLFARPSGIESEESCVFVHPSVKESEAEVSDCSLASTASTASGSQTRKRRQPYLYKPGTAKKPAVDEADVQDPFEIAPATKTKKKDLPTIEDIQQELKACTSIELRARIAESMSTIDKVADSSRNLRGAQAQSLRLAVRSTLAASSELAQRFSTSDVEKLKRENSELRLELGNLKSQLMSLTSEVNSLRQRESGAVGRNKHGEEVKAEKDPLVRRISTLIDQKLAVLRAEIFLEGKDERPSLGKGSVTVAKLKPRGKKERQAKVKNSKDVQPPQPEVMEAPLVPLGCEEMEQPSTETWALVAARKAKAASSTTKKVEKSTRNPISLGWTKNRAKPPPSPKTAAVTITLTESATIGYAAAMTAAKQRINLADCGISQVRQKKAITGGLILEVPGPDSAKKADALADRLRAALVNMGVRIGRPVKTGELRVMDLDESITKQDVVTAIAEAGGCLQEEVKVGDIRFNALRLGTAWVRCPLMTIRKLAEEKHVRVGWVSARYQILANRQLQCFRCLETGHVRKQCSNPEDRSQCCYNCGEQDHKARECQAQVPKCPLCADLGRPADHRLGGVNCKPPTKRRTKSGPQAQTESTRASKTAMPAKQLAEEATETEHSTSSESYRAT